MSAEEKAFEWLKKAEKDLKAAEILMREGLHDYAIFHAQQAVEKALKAFLTYHNKPIKKTHDIDFLIKKCSEIDSEFKSIYDLDIELIYPLGIEVRYPYPEEPTEEEAIKAIDIAKQVMGFIYRKLHIIHTG